MARNGNRYLIFSGLVLVIGALIHVAAIFGGPDWYAFIGAPEQIVQMVRAGKRYPVVLNLLIALLCMLMASYAFSGAGLVRRLPLLVTGLVFISAAMILRAVGFVALLAFSPDALDGLCDCNGVDTFLIVTSTVCLSIGVGIAIGLKQGWRR